MSFLAPLFLLGAAAIALPIVFHLIRRTSREKTVFSSLMFLKPSPPRVTRRSRLENIFLLILRCLALCVLALGFARPFLNKPNAAPVASGPGTMVIVLLDNSASMRRDGLWDTARERARNVLRRLGPTDQVAVMLFNDQLRPLVSFEEWNAAQPGERVELAVSRINVAAPSWNATHLGNALLGALDALSTATRESKAEIVQRIVVISDLQSGARLDGLQGHEWPKGVEVALESVKKVGSNAGLHLVPQSEESSWSSNQVPWRIRLANSADSRKEQFKVSWRGGTGPALETYLPPGQSRVLQPPRPPDGAVGELVLGGDDESFDNTLFWVRSEPSLINILYAGSEADNDATKPLFFLKRALQQTALNQAEVIRLTPPPGTNASSPLIIVGERLQDRAVQAAREHLRAGKTVLVTMNTPAVAETVGQLTGVDQLAASEASVGNYALLGEIDFTHPLFKPFSDPRFSDFTKIHFWKYRRLDATQIPKARVIARFDSGDPALIQCSVDNGTLLVLASGWSPSDSQLALSSKFVPLVYSLIDFSGSPRSVSAQYVIGDPVTVPEGARVRKPDGSEARAGRGDRFAETDTPGVYTVTAAQVTNYFAVNLAPSESRTLPLTIEDLQQLGVPLKLAQPDRSRETARRTQQLQAAEMENQQKLWRWLILAALGVIVLETWLAGRLSREQPAPSAA